MTNSNFNTRPTYQLTFWFGDHFEHLYADWLTECQVALRLYRESQSCDQFRIRKWNGNDYIDLPAEPRWSIESLEGQETAFTTSATLCNCHIGVGDCQIHGNLDRRELGKGRRVRS